MTATAFADASIQRLHRFINELSSTNWVILSGTVVGFLTAAVYLSGILLAKHPDPVTFGMWLSFVAAWIGFGVKQFRIKRETHQPGGDQTPAATPAP